MTHECRTWNTAIYVRLSKEDGDGTVSESISNQKALIRSYLADKPYLAECGVYEDDGYSGANLERPAFKRLMDDIRAQKISCVISKDLSRLGRNYIETGNLLERVFPFMGVRFIAIIDSYDSEKLNPQTDNLIVPFKNLINDAFLADTSRKIRSQFQVKMKNGDYLGAFSPYGYKKDPHNHNKLIIDEDAAQTVRDIFSWKIDGLSPQSIADKLNTAGVPSPLAYKKLQGHNFYTPFTENKTALWSPKSIIRILGNDLYIGTLTQGVFTTPSYKVKRRVKKASEEWISVAQSHDAVVSISDFNLVASLMKKDTRAAVRGKAVHLFSGMLSCGDCGYSLVRKTITRNSKKYVYHVCSNFKNNKKCTSHSLSEAALYEAVLSLINNHIKMCVSISDILQKIDGLPLQRFDIQRIQKQIDCRQTELEKIARRKTKLYEDYTDGLISKDDFLEIKKSFTAQKEQSAKALECLTRELEEAVSVDDKKSEWVEHFQKYHDIPALTRAIVVDLIDHITVFEGNRVKIVFRYQNEFDAILKLIGSIDNTEPETAAI